MAFDREKLEWELTTAIGMDRNGKPVGEWKNRRQPIEDPSPVQVAQLPRAIAVPRPGWDEGLPDEPTNWSGGECVDCRGRCLPGALWCGECMNKWAASR